MKQHLKVVSVLTLGLVVIIALSQILVSGQSGQGRSLQGSWLVASTIRDCQTGQALGTNPILNTFFPGGSMISNASVNPAVLSTGHGTWSHTAGHEFTNTLRLFQFSPVNGSFGGTITIRRVIQLVDGSDEFSSVDTAEAADPSGNVIGIRCATAVGHRVE